MPLASTAVHRTLVIPSGKDEPDGGTQLKFAPGQLSITDGVGKFTAGEHWPGDAVTATLDGHTTLIRSISLTVTVNEHVAVAPPASVATQLTVVVPMAKLEPVGGEQTTLANGQLSTATGVKKLTVAVHLPGSFTWIMPAGQDRLGARLVARTVAVATLLSGLASGVEELNTVAVFPTMDPFGVAQLTLATMVMTALAPGASDAKVIVRVLPDPPQTPPPVELHDWNDTLVENTSVTVIEVAVPGPMLLTRIVLVRSEPASTGLGDMVVSTARSADPPPDKPPS